MLSGRVAKHGLPRGGKNLIKGMLYLNLNHWKHGLPRAGECCQVGSQSMGCQGGGNLLKGMLSGRVAQHGLPRGENFDKRNAVLELESLEAWVAKGGGMLSGRVAKHGLPRGGGKNW